MLFYFSNYCMCLSCKVALVVLWSLICTYVPSSVATRRVWGQPRGLATPGKRSLKPPCFMISPSSCLILLDQCPVSLSYGPTCPLSPGSAAAGLCPRLTNQLSQFCILVITINWSRDQVCSSHHPPRTTFLAWLPLWTGLIPASAEQEPSYSLLRR